MKYSDVKILLDGRDEHAARITSQRDALAAELDVYRAESADARYAAQSAADEREEMRTEMGAARRQRDALTAAIIAIQDDIRDNCGQRVFDITRDALASIL